MTHRNDESGLKHDHVGRVHHRYGALTHSSALPTTRIESIDNAIELFTEVPTTSIQLYSGNKFNIILLTSMFNFGEKHTFIYLIFLH